MHDLDELILRENRETLDIEGLEIHRQILLRLVEQSRVRIDIISRTLDRRLFDRTPVVSAMRSVALSSRHARVRMLVMDTGALVRQEHRLVNLVKRLPSYFSIRMPGRDHKNFNAAIVVADKAGFIYRPYADLYEGQACFNDPVRAGELTRQFDEIWEAGQPDVNLRQMTL